MRNPRALTFEHFVFVAGIAFFKIVIVSGYLTKAENDRYGARREGTGIRNPEWQAARRAGERASGTGTERRKKE